MNSGILALLLRVGRRGQTGMPGPPRPLIAQMRRARRVQLLLYWLVAVMIGVVMAGHQAFSLSLFSTITDVVPGAKVGRVTAFGAFMGNMGGVGISLITGRVLDAGLGFVPLFVFAASSYLVALAWFQWLIPTIRRDESELRAPV